MFYQNIPFFVVDIGLCLITTTEVAHFGFGCTSNFEWCWDIQTQSRNTDLT